MIWLLITIAMGAGVIIGITAYSAANPIELPQARPCEPRLEETQELPSTTQEHE